MTLVVWYDDGLELVETLRPLLAAHGYVVTPAANVGVQGELEALDRLFEIARHDTHQSRRVADFLLAWWNARRDGGFDLTSLWNLDTAICEDLSIVFNLIASSRSYPDAFGYDAAIRGLVESNGACRRHKERLKCTGSG